MTLFPFGRGPLVWNVIGKVFRVEIFGGIISSSKSHALADSIFAAYTFPECTGIVQNSFGSTVHWWCFGVDWARESKEACGSHSFTLHSRPFGRRNFQFNRGKKAGGTENVLESVADLAVSRQNFSRGINRYLWKVMECGGGFQGS